MGPPPKDGVDRAKARASSPAPRKPGAPAKGKATASTPRKSPEKVIKPKTDRHERFTQLAGALPFIVWTATPEGTVDYFNNALVEYSGRDPETLLNDGWTSVLHPDDLTVAIDQRRRTVATGDPYEIHVRLCRWDGEYRWHKVRSEPEFDDDGTIFRRWGSAIDIHDLHMLEEQAGTLAVEREAILESLGHAVYTLDREFRFVYLNSHALALMHVTAEEALGKVAWEVLPQIRATGGIEVIQRVLETGQSDRRQVFSEPLKAWLDISLSPTPNGVTASIQDITHVKTLSKQLNRAQRLEAIGQLTGGIAHDFNNLLTVVFGAAESLALESRLSPAGRGMVDLISQAATRAAELTHHLLAFARKQPLAPEAIDISKQVTDLVPFLKRTLGEGIEVASVLATGLPAAHVDPGQFENALLNLAINARDAMPEGGILEIETSVTELDEDYAATHSEAQPGTYVLVSIGDTGEGIAPEHLERLFDPFFTTKPLGQGSGLGLSMVWGFVKQSGGHVAVYSESGRGTTFRLYLPVAPEDASREAENPTGEGPPTRCTGHILLVEDDEFVRTFATDQLSAYGYQVTAAASGPEALELLKGINHLDLLFTDVILPGGMTGRELAAEVVTRMPGTLVLYASGYTADILMHDGQLDPEVVLLSKPYSGKQLLERVQQLISAPRTEAT